MSNYPKLLKRKRSCYTRTLQLVLLIINPTLALTTGTTANNPDTLTPANNPDTQHQQPAAEYIAQIFRQLPKPVVPPYDPTPATVNVSLLPDQHRAALRSLGEVGSTDHTRFFNPPPLTIQKPHLPHLEAPNLTPPETASTRVTDLVDIKFYDGYIKPGDLSSTAASSGAMYTISRDGRYFISNDITVAPNNNSVTAIRITANNVLLDLNRTTLSQSTSSSATGLIGIEIAANVTNVIIQNGRIDNFNGSGININAGAYNVIIRDVVIMGATGFGITAYSVGSLYLQNVNALAGNTDGALFTSCDMLTIQNSNFNNNTIGGVSIISCNQCIIENCSFNDNIDASGSAYGVVISVTTNCWFKNCQAAYNQGNTSVRGFYVVGNCTNLRFTNCAAYGQLGGDSATHLAAGFFCNETTQYSTIENCYSYGNGGGTTYAGYGIYFGDGSSLGPLNCVVRNCQIYDNVGTSKSYGFYDFAAQSTTVLAGNVAYGNGKINPGAGNLSPTNSNNANYVITYNQTPTHASSSLFLEGNLTEIGAINTSTTTGSLGEFQNLSIIS